MELVIVGSIVTLIGTVLIEFFIRESDFLQTSMTRSELRTQAHLALNTMIDELRHGSRSGAGSPPNVSIPASPNNTTLSLCLPMDLDGNGLIVDTAGVIEWDVLTPVQYQYVPASRQLDRINGANTQVVANDVQSVVFEDATIDASLADDEVRIILTLQRTTQHRRSITESATAIVKLRNS